MSAPQASFNLFLMEPMVDLEPGVAEETDRLTSLTLNWNEASERCDQNFARAHLNADCVISSIRSFPKMF